MVVAVGCAARHGLSVSTQPVGHGATTALTGTVLLRTGALQDLGIDVERRVARVGAGVKWGTLLAALEPTGLMALAGSSPDPSVVGFTLGGGLSWFSRALGLTAHSVVAFEIVDATGPVDGSRPPATRTCSGPCAVGAATSGSSSPSRSCSTTWVRSSAAGCCGRWRWPGRSCAPSARSRRMLPTSSPCGHTCSGSRRCRSFPSSCGGAPSCRWT